jgi:uncharacterized protein YndB with AHSA1/START domain
VRPFTVERDTDLRPEQAWARLTDWPAHARWVPLTAIEVRTPPPTGPGTVFVARTALGRFGFDDPMEIVAWDPPRFCRIEKRGSALVGWAELTVEPRGTGSRVSWREVARPARLPGFLGRPADASGRLLFGRVLRGLLV